MKIIELYYNIAKRMACAEYAYGNCSLITIDGKQMYQDGLKNIRENTPENHVIYYGKNNEWAKNCSEVWDLLTEEEHQKLLMQASAAYEEMAKIPIRQMYAMMWEGYIPEK